MGYNDLNHILLKGITMNEDTTTENIETIKKSIVPVILWSAVMVATTVVNLVATWKGKHVTTEYMEYRNALKAVPTDIGISPEI